MKHLICDFCAAPNPPRKYLCAPFNMMDFMGIEQWSDNAWAACTVCAGLIDTEQWTVLAQRSLDHDPMKKYMNWDEQQKMLYFLLELHDKFRVNKGRVA